MVQLSEHAGGKRRCNVSALEVHAGVGIEFQGCWRILRGARWSVVKESGRRTLESE